MVTIDNTNYEIGSHFWIDFRNQNEYEGDSDIWLPEVEHSTLTFSGRSAIELALLDAIQNKRVTTAYLPSYCCESMVTPFIKNGIHIDFYDVSFQEGKFRYTIEKNVKHDIALVMSYFGLCADNAHSLIEELSGQGTIVIEDITHSLLRRKQNSPQSDYLVAGLRKWFAIPTGGWLGKKKGKLQFLPYKSSEYYVRDKIEGMKEKARYVLGEKVEKDRFLELQNSFEAFLDKHDCMLKIDATSQQIINKLSISSIRHARKSNAGQLYKAIQAMNIEGLQIPELNLDNDTPLFFPIFLNHTHRESLQKYLIEHHVYCPVHWPKVEGVPFGVRGNELSIICDQRYSDKDMTYIAEVIQTWGTHFFIKE